MPKILRVTLSVICTILTSYFIIALGLIFLQGTVDLSEADSISFAGVAGQTQQSAILLKSIPSDNGTTIRYRHFRTASDKAPLVVVVHGSGWHGAGYLDIAKTLSDSGRFEVLVPGLRGHGIDPVRRGDVDYIGQLEDDLAALINAHGGIGGMLPWLDIRVAAAWPSASQGESMGAC